MNIRLPDDSGLDIGALAGSLSDTTNSYKFLWFLGLLECLGDAAKKSGAVVIPQKLVCRKMIRAAEYCIRRYRLSFGVSDKMETHLRELARAAHSAGTASFLDGDGENREISAALDKVCRDLSRFVPQQWLVPFVKHAEKLPAGSDAVAAKVRELAARLSNGDSPPPYHFAADRRGADIVVHKEWNRYFIRNNEIVRGWALFKWITFLQSRNPNTPGIVAKIAQPERRAQLDKERKWWRAMIARIGGVECIYSGAPIGAADDFALDHYVPWSFVGHNRLWNLIPATPRANGGKSDNLPDAEKYFDKFVRLQHSALTAYCDCRERGWGDIVDSYIGDLHININPPPSAQKLADAYRTIIPPLMTLAQSQGFSAGWDYDNRAATKESPPDLF